ncbi:MAG: hypothetical protein EOO38_19630 [Cytophagaceae bacterium]|nr:MAG: hypothetical protein EOO38_19630 [Cytophagaceae bacterium]
MTMAVPKYFIAHIKSMLRHPVEYVESYRPQRQATDLARWQNPENLRSDWDERTKLIGAYIPDASAVVEFGAARLVLPLYIGKSCTYQPVDLVKRSEDTLVFDLNGQLEDLPHFYDYAVFSGVLEYVHDLPRLMRWLPSVARNVVFSYGVTDFLSDPISRRRNGWVNNMSHTDVLTLLSQYALTCVSTQRWKEQKIYNCRYSSQTAY